MTVSTGTYQNARFQVPTAGLRLVGTKFAGGPPETVAQLGPEERCVLWVLRCFPEMQSPTTSHAQRRLRQFQHFLGAEAEGLLQAFVVVSFKGLQPVGTQRVSSLERFYLSLATLLQYRPRVEAEQHVSQKICVALERLGAVLAVLGHWLPYPVQSWAGLLSQAYFKAPDGQYKKEVLPRADSRSVWPELMAAE